MRCYHCGAELTKGNLCPDCGANVKVYKKMMSFSNRLYNEGIEKATVRDMTGAVACLRQSLKLNKNNIDARNLLGLVYYETGEVVPALAEWVISKNLRAENNIADEYMDMVRNNPARLDNINQMIKKYNIALRYCNQGSLDLAVIQLKKVLSLENGFVNAHLLLSLLYLNQKNFEKAKAEAEKTLKLDRGNTRAMLYLREAENESAPIDGVSDKKAVSSENDVIRYQSGNEMIIQPVRTSPFKGSGSIWGIVLGAVLGVAMACFLILPSRIQAVNTANQAKITQISEESDAKSAQINDYTHQIETLTRQSQDLQAQIDSYQGTDSTIGAMNSLMKAVADYLADQTNMEAITKDLENVDLAQVGDSVSPEFNSLYASFMTLVGPDLATQYYETGYKAYQDEDYETAISNLSKANQYDSTNVNTVYYLGNAYYKSGDTENAKTIFDKVITDFPGTQSAQSAQAKLAEINNSGN